MSEEEIVSAIKWGKSAISMFDKRNEPVPEWVYRRVIELCIELISSVGITVE